MALFGRDYDREYYGYRGTRNDMYAYDRGYGTYGAAGVGYDRNYKSRWETDYGDPFNDRGSNTPIRMIRGEYRGYDRNYGAFDYDRGYRGTATGYTGVGYDRGFRGTPRGYTSVGYDRTYAANPVGYEPNYNRAEMNRGMGYDRTFRTYNRGRGYDQGWF